VSSEEPKAVGTAEIIAERLGAELTSHPGLHEHGRTGLPFGTEEEFHLSARNFFEKPSELVWGNETAEQTLERFAGAVHDVLEQHRESSVAVVAHGTVNTLFLTRHGSIDAYAFWRKLGLPSFYVLSLPEFELRNVVYDIRS
jgi:broad specificity phosphatase PhoE